MWWRGNGRAVPVGREGRPGERVGAVEKKEEGVKGRGMIGRE